MSQQSHTHEEDNTRRHQRCASVPVDLHREASTRTLVASKSSITDDDKAVIDGSSTIVNQSGVCRSDSTRSDNKQYRWTAHPPAAIKTDIHTIEDDDDDVSSTSTKNGDDDDASPASTIVPASKIEPYTVFSRGKVRWIVLLVSVAAFFAPFSVNSYFPAMNTIELDLNITSQQVNLTVTVFMIFQAVSPAFWSSMADTRGRRPVYICTLFIYLLSCVGLAMSSNYAILLSLRMVQAFGASSVIAIGAGVIADVTHPSKRGGYLGWYSLGWNLGPVVGPAIGGVVSQYLGWRWIFWLLAITGGVHWLILGFCLPETLRKLVGNGSGYCNPTPYEWWCHRREVKQKSDEEKADSDLKNDTFKKPENTMTRRQTWLQWLLDPLQPLLYAKEKDILILLIFYSVQYAACYTVTTSMPVLFGELYGLNDILIGISYFPNGAGCIVGSIVQGKILNKDYRKMRQRFSVIPQVTSSDLDMPIEHTRLRTVWVHAAIFNVLLIVYGWCLYVKTHIAIVLILQFVLGFTSQAIFNAIQTLFVDLYPTRSASITASNNIFRCLFGAAATTAILPGIQKLGVGWVFTVVSAILLLSRIPMYYELKHGPRWRRERAERLASKSQC